MAKKEKEPCEYCGNDMYSNVIDEEGFDQHSLEVELKPGVSVNIYSYALHDIDSWQTERLEVHLPMYYCPNCGRKLKK